MGQAATAPFFSFFRNPEKKAARKAKKRALSHEDRELVQGLETAKGELAKLHSRFDHITDEVLVDALIFERKALELKYKYYHNQLKVKGIVYGE